MAFWSRKPSHGTDTTPNDQPRPVPPSIGEGYSPGDPDGFELAGEDTYSRSLPLPLPSTWSGWPAEWNVPNWDFASRFNELVDIAWACLDLNSRIMATMPVYRTRDGRVIEPASWMSNPDPTIYTSWHEFAKQLFWDYMLGEAFVMPVAIGTDGLPLTFRVVPPWMMDVEMKGGIRRYRLGGTTGPDVTDEVLHIRYKSTTDGAHGVGPLEAAGGRMLTAGVLAAYVRDTARLGGVPAYTLETDQQLNGAKAQQLLDGWVAACALNLGAPPVLDAGVTLKTHMSMSPRDMAMLEISQFTEARIAVLLGVPPFLVALPSGQSEIYSNVSQVFDFHDRSSLRPSTAAVMAALSAWSLPVDEAAELNRDEYSRPALNERVTAYEVLHRIGVITSAEIRAIERIPGSILPDPTVDVGGDNDAAMARNIAEMVQKIYLGVGVVITADEARDVINQAGGELSGGFKPAKPAPVAASVPVGG